MTETALPGADPIISPSVSEQFVRSQAMADLTDMKMRMFALGAMYGENRDRLRTIEQDVKEVARRVIAGSPVPGAAGPPSAGGPPSSSTGAAPDPQDGDRGGVKPAPVYPAGTVVGDDGQPVVPQREQVMPMTWSEGRQIGSSATGLAAWAGKAISQRTPTFGRNPETGELIPERYVFDEAIGPQEAYVQRNPSTGEVTNAIPVGPGAEDQVADEEGMSNRSRMVTGALARYGAGEGIMGAVGGGARAGVAGLVATGLYHGIKKGFDKWSEQTAAAAPYRQAYGEEAGGLFAAGPRFQRWATGLEGTFTGVGGERAKAGYDAAVSLGLRDERLEAATEFDTDMYKRYGMSPEQSMQFVRLSTENANESLDEFRTQIEAVSRAAVEAGRSSQAATEAYLSSVQQLTAFADTGTAGEVAGRLNTQLQQNMPTNLAQPENIAAAAGVLNEQNILMNATMAGAANPLAALTAAQADPNLQLGNIEATLTQAVEMISNSGAGLTSQQLRAEMENMFGGKPGQDEWVQITQRWPNLNVIVMRSVFQALGYAVPPGDEFQTFIEGLFGGFEGIQGNGKTWSPMELLLGKDAASGPRVIEGGYDTKDVNKALDPTGAGNTDLRAYGLNAREAVDEYKEYGERTGNRNTAIESLIRHSKDIETQTGQDFDEIKFDTSQGEKSLVDIINSKELRAELTSGSVNVQAKGGESLGLSQWIGSPDSGGEGSATGVVPSGDSAMVGGVRLDLTPTARQILRLTGPTDAQQSGTPALGTVNPFGWSK